MLQVNRWLANEWTRLNRSEISKRGIVSTRLAYPWYYRHRSAQSNLTSRKIQRYSCNLTSAFFKLEAFELFEANLLNVSNDPVTKKKKNINITISKSAKYLTNALSRRLWREQEPVRTDYRYNRRACCEFIECGVRSRASSLRAKQKNLPRVRGIGRVTACPRRSSMFSTKWIVTRVTIDVKAQPANNITTELKPNTSPTPTIPVRYIYTFYFYFSTSLLHTIYCMPYWIFMKVIILQIRSLIKIIVMTSSYKENKW